MKRVRTAGLSAYRMVQMLIEAGADQSDAWAAGICSRWTTQAQEAGESERCGSRPSRARFPS
eukprot:6589254-Pyramimonas_sp.AAC.1